MAGVYETDLDELISLFEGQQEKIEALGVELSSGSTGSLLPAKRTVRASQFVPRDYAYYLNVLRALRDCT
ncbi:hypothetical protein D3C79_1058110 [compost metagenome]